jgi:hypothetical protein
MVTNIKLATLATTAATIAVVFFLGPVGASGGLEGEGVISSVGVGGGLIATGEIAKLIGGQNMT